MSYPSLFIPIAFVLLLSSCSSNRALVSSVKPSEVNSLHHFAPVAYISLIEHGNKAAYDEDLSSRSSELVSRVLQTSPNLPYNGEIRTVHQQTYNRMQREVEYLCLKADQTHNISSLKLTPVLDSLLESKHQRFGLLTITAGFTRRQGNYGGQVAKSLGIGLLTLGMFVPNPIKSSSTVYLMIIDSQNDNITFFRKSALRDAEPLSSDVLRRQVTSIFEGYFWPKP